MSTQPSLIDHLRRVSLEYDNDEPVTMVRARDGTRLASPYFPVISPFMTAFWRGRKPKIVVANTFLVWPAQSGGQQRILNIYGHLCERADITLVNLSSVGTKLRTVEFGPHFREIIVPQSREHFEFEERLRSRLDGMPVADIAAIQGIGLTPLFGKILKRALAHAALAVADHPYGFNALRNAWSGPIVYSAHNDEMLLKSAMLPKTDFGRTALAEVEESERACCEHSSAIFAVSEQDVATMADRYRIPRDKFAVLPNGVNIPKNPVLDYLQREKNKQRLSLRGPVALYVGGWHGPNLDGALLTYEIARQAPDWRFLLVGSMCDAPVVRDTPRPPNVDLLGQLSQRELVAIMAAADVGLNPVIAGGGSSLKILHYAAHGLLVLTTPIGNRGILLRDGEHCIVAEPADMPAALIDVSKRGLKTFEPIARAGSNYIAMNFSWRDIVGRVRLPGLG